MPTLLLKLALAIVHIVFWSQNYNIGCEKKRKKEKEKTPKGGKEPKWFYFMLEISKKRLEKKLSKFE